MLIPFLRACRAFPQLDEITHPRVHSHTRRDYAFIDAGSASPLMRGSMITIIREILFRMKQPIKLQLRVHVRFVIISHSSVTRNE